ncbi:DUF6153 family protein [Streptomyces albiflavescens]|uniref:DUF6153 family protein n=1 Tax=Streptomyces albiflavescens TaxID=1623582 RepID=UPI001E32D98C|nr:DUF6153 family protein [Streptomyces albiflavescens]
MTGPGQLARPQLALRSCVLLVCTLLLGLLGMHGLGPVPGAHADSGHHRMAVTAHTDVTASMPGECDHGDGGCKDHVAHADPTCASASVAGTPVVVPVLLPDVVTCGEQVQAGTSPFGSGPDGGRAPPSLSELQLLRI